MVARGTLFLEGRDFRISSGVKLSEWSTPKPLSEIVVVLCLVSTGEGGAGGNASQTAGTDGRGVHSCVGSLPLAY